MYIEPKSRTFFHLASDRRLVFPAPSRGSAKVAIRRTAEAELQQRWSVYSMHSGRCSMLSYLLSRYGSATTAKCDYCRESLGFNVHRYWRMLAQIEPRTLPQFDRASASQHYQRSREVNIICRVNRELGGSLRAPPNERAERTRIAGRSMWLEGPHRRRLRCNRHQRATLVETSGEPISEKAVKLKLHEIQAPTSQPPPSIREETDGKSIFHILY